MSVGDFVRNSQVWKSIFRHPAPRDRRNRVVVMLTNVFLHLHPVSVRKSGIALSYTWCMGGITFFLFLVETVTGVLLMFYYRPTLEHAYNDILALRDVATLGILRELHRWGAHAMVITIWLHMYRVFLTGSYKPPREFNWGVGVVLLVLTLFLSPCISGASARTAASVEHFSGDWQEQTKERQSCTVPNTAWARRFRMGWPFIIFCWS